MYAKWCNSLDTDPDQQQIALENTGAISCGNDESQSP